MENKRVPVEQPDGVSFFPVYSVMSDHKTGIIILGPMWAKRQHVVINSCSASNYEQR